MKGRPKPPFLGVTPLPVNFDVYTRPVHIVPIIVMIALMHIEARSTRHALALTEAIVTHLAAHTIRLGGDCHKGCDKTDRGGAHQHRPHFALLFPLQRNEFPSQKKTRFAISLFRKFTCRQESNWPTAATNSNCISATTTIWRKCDCHKSGGSFCLSIWMYPASS